MQGDIKMNNKTFQYLILFIVLLVPAFAGAETTEFTVQGTLPDIYTNGAYDFEFRLFSVATGGTAIAVQQRLGVLVNNGNYKVNLALGSSFPGAARYLETGYKFAPGPFTTITPRDVVTSAPYATVV